MHSMMNQMAARRRGGIILMFSMAWLQGAPMVATYGATKAFSRGSCTVFSAALGKDARLAASGAATVP
jgi:short-subunit dehydrogenase